MPAGCQVSYPKSELVEEEASLLLVKTIALWCYQLHSPSEYNQITALLYFGANSQINSPLGVRRLKLRQRQ